MEFLSIFIAVISAFALNNWNDQRKDREAAAKILTEMAQGLEKDIEDIRLNIFGHEEGLKSCVYWSNIINNRPFNPDSLLSHYFNFTRDFISAQNSAGYETLKSRGLELIENDSLRYDIISLYEYDYKALKAFEENYYEMQFQENYFKDFNQQVAPYFEFDEKGKITSIRTPLSIGEADRKILMSYLWKISANRRFILHYYTDMENKVRDLIHRMEREIVVLNG